MSAARLLMGWIIVALLVSAPAFVGAAEDGTVKDGGGTVYSAKNAKSKEIVALKGGSKVRVLVKQGDWMRVKTDAGKMGWISATAIEVAAVALGPEHAGGADDMGLDGTEVASVERNTTGGAIRGRPGERSRRAVVVVIGYSDADAAALDAAVVSGLKDVEVIARVIKPAAKMKAGPAGGAAGGRSLARALGADLVIAVAPSKGKVSYEVVDARANKVLVVGMESSKKLQNAFSAIAKKAAAKLE